MKIAVPTEDGRLSGHFGGSKLVTLLTVSDGAIVEQQVLETPPHEPGRFPVWLHEQGADVVVAGGMGQRALSLLDQHGIRVVVGAPSATPTELAEAYIAGTLTGGENSCTQGPGHHCDS